MNLLIADVVSLGFSARCSQQAEANIQKGRNGFFDKSLNLMNMLLHGSYRPFKLQILSKLILFVNIDVAER